MCYLLELANVLHVCAMFFYLVCMVASWKKKKPHPLIILEKNMPEKLICMALLILMPYNEWVKGQQGSALDDARRCLPDHLMFTYLAS